MVEHALPGSTHMGLLANDIKWMGGFPPYPPKIEKNWKPESHAEEAHCSVHVILFTALSATPSTFNSLSNIFFISPLPVAPQPRARCQPSARIYGHIGDGFDPKWLIFTSVKESADGWHPKISQGRWAAAGIFLADLCHKCLECLPHEPWWSAESKSKSRRTKELLNVKTTPLHRCQHKNRSVADVGLYIWM